MKNKLIEILNNINLEEEYIKLFNDSYIDKIILDKNNKTYKINICTNKNIEENIINHIKKLFLNKYKNINDVNFEIVNISIETEKNEIAT